MDTDHQWSDIFTKALAEERFNFIKKNLGLVTLTNEVHLTALDKVSDESLVCSDD